jgi:hypothetical protein
MDDANSYHSTLGEGVKMSTWQPSSNVKVLNYSGISSEEKVCPCNLLLKIF